MGEEDAETEASQAAAINGSSSPEKKIEPVADDTNAMDEDVKDDAKLETEKMDEDPKIKDETNTKEVDEDTEEGAVIDAEGKGLVEEEKVSKEKVEEMQNQEDTQHEETKEDAEEEKREHQVEAMEQDSESAEKKVVGEKGTSDDTEQEKIVMSTKGEEDEETTKGENEEDKDMREDKEVEDEVKEQKEEEDEVKEEKEESEEMNEVKEEEKGSNNHRKGKGARGKGEDKAKSVKTKKELEPKTPVTPAIDRPVRERKSVERLVAIIEKDSSKDFHVEKGRGTALKDIPNVAYKLSRKKSDETFKLLHTILFGRRGKAFQIKNNISRFSGFAWQDNEDKQKMKVKEKLDKCNKEKLLEFCDVLDIPISKATPRKEDIITKLIEFMLAPHATTDVLLLEKDLSSKGKRKRVTKPSSSGGTPRSTKSRRKMTDTSKSKDRKYTSGSEGELEEEEDEEETNEESEKEKENGVHSRTLDGSSEQSASEEKDSESEEDSDEDTKTHKHISKKSSVKKESASRTKSDKTVTPKKSKQPPKSAPKKSVSNRTKVDYDSDSSPKVSSKKKEKSSTLKPPTPSKAATPSKLCLQFLCSALCQCLFAANKKLSPPAARRGEHVTWEDNPPPAGAKSNPTACVSPFGNKCLSTNNGSHFSTCRLSDNVFSIISDRTFRHNRLSLSLSPITLTFIHLIFSSSSPAPRCPPSALFYNLHPPSPPPTDFAFFVIIYCPSLCLPGKKLKPKIKSSSIGA